MTAWGKTERLAAGDLRIRDFRCWGEKRPFVKEEARDVGRAPEPLAKGDARDVAVELPRLGAHVRSCGRETFAVDATAIAILCADATYFRASPSAAPQTSTLLTLSGELAERLARSKCRVEVSRASAAAHEKLLASASPLELHERALALVEAIAVDAGEPSSGLAGDRSPPPSWKRLATQVQYVLATRYAEALSLDDVARACAVSAFHAARVFRAVTGRSIHQQLVRVRIHHALYELSGGAGALTAVARRAGFSSHSHFTSTFRRVLGVAPSESPPARARFERRWREDSNRSRARPSERPHRPSRISTADRRAPVHTTRMKADHRPPARILRSMQLRRFASLSSALAVAIVAGTGALGFVSAGAAWVLTVHAVVGFAFVAFVALHVAHNAGPLLLATVTKRRRVPSLALVIAFALVGGVAALAYADVPPVHSLLAWGKQRRESGQLPKTTYTTIALDAHGEGPTLSIDLKAGSAFRIFDAEHGYDMTPQIAIWVEDEEGRYVETLYVTHSEATGEYSPVRDGEIVRRPEALPVWGHARGVQAADGLFVPSRQAPLPDVVTAASPLESAYFVTPARTKLRRFAVLVEVSNACDFNDYYRRDAYPDDPVYSGDGLPAQPSAVYRGLVDTDSERRFVVLDLVGHGHVSGRDGKIDPDVSHMTTGLQIVDRVVVEVRKPGR